MRPGPGDIPLACVRVSGQPSHLPVRCPSIASPSQAFAASPYIDPELQKFLTDLAAKDDPPSYMGMPLPLQPRGMFFPRLEAAGKSAATGSVTRPGWEGLPALRPGDGPLGEGLQPVARAARERAREDSGFASPSPRIQAFISGTTFLAQLFAVRAARKASTSASTIPESCSVR